MNCYYDVDIIFIQICCTRNLEYWITNNQVELYSHFVCKFLLLWVKKLLQITQVYFTEHRDSSTPLFHRGYFSLDIPSWYGGSGSRKIQYLCDCCDWISKQVSTKDLNSLKVWHIWKLAAYTQTHSTQKNVANRLLTKKNRIPWLLPGFWNRIPHHLFSDRLNKLKIKRILLFKKCWGNESIWKKKSSALSTLYHTFTFALW